MYNSVKRNWKLPIKTIDAEDKLPISMNWCKYFLVYASWFLKNIAFAFTYWMALKSEYTKTSHFKEPLH